MLSLTSLTTLDYFVKPRKFILEVMGAGGAYNWLLWVMTFAGVSYLLSPLGLPVLGGLVLIWALAEFCKKNEARLFPRVYAFLLKICGAAGATFLPLIGRCYLRQP